jgi:hypothetical protein
MLFMSQSGLTDAQRQAEWEQWYLAHLRAMLTVNSIDSAQRFTLIQGDNAPSLALYTIATPEVFQDPTYLRIRGMGEWLPLIDRRHYRRNLFAGLDTAPDVPAADVLLVADREQPEPALAGIAWAWLEAVALDRSPRYRGVAVVSHTDALHAHGAGVASYRPVTARLTKMDDTTPVEEGGDDGQGTAAGGVQLQQCRRGRIP